MQFWEEKAYARDEGRAEGLKEGIKEGMRKGENKKLIQIVCRMLRRKNTPEEIADDLEENVDYIKKIHQIAEECSYDFDKIYASLQKM